MLVDHQRYSIGGRRMLTVKEAVQAAEKWVRDLYPEGDIRHLRLEEVEFSDDGHWRITLGWAESAIRQNNLTAALQPDVYALPRVYKTLEVDAESGEVKSMKIREVA
jgi:hypothetical protein